MILRYDLGVLPCKSDLGGYVVHGLVRVDVSRIFFAGRLLLADLEMLRQCHTSDLRHASTVACCYPMFPF